MLIRLIYASTSSDNVDITEFKNILLQAQTNNQRCDLTGMLAFNSKVFLQALEGDRDQVNELYGRLMRDPRHHSLAVLKFGEIEERHWSNWSMGFAAPNADNRALFLKHSTQSIFNPYVMKSEAVEKMLMNLSSTVIAMSATATVAEPANEQTAVTKKALATSVSTPMAEPANGGGIFARFLKK